MHAPGPALSDLLACFLASGDAMECERLLERLVCEQAGPVASRIVASRVPPAAVEDVRNEILTGLIARLREMKETGGETGIRDFAAYAAVVAFHGCNEYFRQCYPRRYRLRNRLRYLLTKDRRFALWQDAGGEWMCGRREWRPAGTGQPDSPPAGQASWESSRETAALAMELFDESGAAMRLDDLVAAVAQRWGITDRPDDSAAEPAAGAQIEIELQNRQWLERLWAEIAALPVRQRAALLLNLRDHRGGSALALLPATGVATLRQIAAALEMEAMELAELWNDLPLADRRIAARLNATRQQVINLRKSARERLGRRLG